MLTTDPAYLVEVEGHIADGGLGWVDRAVRSADERNGHAADEACRQVIYPERIPQHCHDERDYRSNLAECACLGRHSHQAQQCELR